MAAPTISIILCTYNGARYLGESIDSVLAQTFGDFELIIVIDGSTDETRDVIAKRPDPRIQVIDEGHQGLPESLNKGFARAQGRYWTYTSDDNAFLPDALRVMFDYLEARPRVPMVCTDLYIMDSNGRTISYNDDAWACFLYRADAARLAGPYRPEFWLVEDVDFFLRLQHVAGPIERVERPYYRYRVHPKSLTATQAREKQLRSLALHYDLVTRGLEQADLKEIFFDRMSQAALYRDATGIAKMVEFGRERKVPFVGELEARGKFLATRRGWLENRVRVLVRSQLGRLRRRVRLMRKGQRA